MSALAIDWPTAAVIIGLGLAILEHLSQRHTERNPPVWSDLVERVVAAESRAAAVEVRCEKLEQALASLKTEK